MDKVISLVTDDEDDVIDLVSSDEAPPESLVRVVESDAKKPRRDDAAVATDLMNAKSLPVSQVKPSGKPVTVLQPRRKPPVAAPPKTPLTAEELAARNKEGLEKRMAKAALEREAAAAYHAALAARPKLLDAFKAEQKARRRAWQRVRHEGLKKAGIVVAVPPPAHGPVSRAMTSNHRRIQRAVAAREFMRLRKPIYAAAADRIRALRKITVPWTRAEPKLASDAESLAADEARSEDEEDDEMDDYVDEEETERLAGIFFKLIARNDRAGIEALFGRAALPTADEIVPVYTSVTKLEGVMFSVLEQIVIKLGVNAPPAPARRVDPFNRASVEQEKKKATDPIGRFSLAALQELFVEANSRGVELMIGSYFDGNLGPDGEEYGIDDVRALLENEEISDEAVRELRVKYGLYAVHRLLADEEEAAAEREIDALEPRDELEGLDDALAGLTLW